MYTYPLGPLWTMRTADSLFNISFPAWAYRQAKLYSPHQKASTPSSTSTLKLQFILTRQKFTDSIWLMLDTKVGVIYLS